MKVREFRSLIYMHYDSESQLAKDLKWDRRKLNRITNGHCEPNIVELQQLSEKLNLSIGDLAQIFLRHKSPNG